MNTSRGAPRSHDEAFQWIPWLVNGRVPQEHVEWLGRHIAECDVCRNEVEDQRRLREAIRQDESNIEYAPQAALQKLWARIEVSDHGAASQEGIDHVVDRENVPPDARRPEPRPQRWMLAAATVLAVGLGLLLALSWRAQVPGSAEYRTATAPTAVPDRVGQIRAVFSPSVTVDELTRIVTETRLTIVAGPSDSGVYTLAVQPGQDLAVEDALVRLRNDPRVRFAEPVVAP